MKLRTVTATRYVTPLKEGGSLPAIVEADDDGLYVLKFRGAGQGAKVLVAELVAGELARAAGLPIPEIVFIELDPDLARTEPDPEIQRLIRQSGGLNIALDYLPGAVTFDPVRAQPTAALASAIVWFDAYVTNVDRTPRNTNMLMWHKELWLIDHGAALYFHHSWHNWKEAAKKPFLQVKDHVLLPLATQLDEADADFRSILTEERIRSVVDLIPGEWLTGESSFETPEQYREAYIQFLMIRIAHSEIFVKEAQNAAEALI